MRRATRRPRAADPDRTTEPAVKLSSDNAKPALSISRSARTLLAARETTIPLGVASTFAPDRRPRLKVDSGPIKQMFLDQRIHAISARCTQGGVSPLSQSVSQPPSSR